MIKFQIDSTDKHTVVECEKTHCTVEETGDDCRFVFFDEDADSYGCAYWSCYMELDQERCDPLRCQDCLDHEKSLVQEKEKAE